MDFAAAPDVFPPDKLNAGVMVVRPNRAVFLSMMRRIDLPSHDGGDTGTAAAGACACAAHWCHTTSEAQ